MLIDKQVNTDIFSKICDVLGYEIKSESIDPVILLRIKKLAEIKKIVYILSEVIRGENGRVKNHLLLRIGNKINNDQSLLTVQFEMIQLQINNKIKEIADSILKATLQSNIKDGRSGIIHISKSVEINCPSCNSSLLNKGTSILLCEKCGKKLHASEIIPLLENEILLI